ncbi:hypothetical protein AO242_12780 [Pseudomonas sp. ICMP 561]|nr:hypothetical protein AO242_12780 [Pseudomonas sp. ICMP 561]
MSSTLRRYAIDHAIEIALRGRADPDGHHRSNNTLDSRYSQKGELTFGVYERAEDAQTGAL